MIVPVILFVINVILAIADAAVAFHKAPHLIAVVNPDPEGRESGEKKLKSILPLLVALYVSLDCYAYSLRSFGYLAGISLLLIGDILVQLLVARKGEKCEG